MVIAVGASVVIAVGASMMVAFAVLGW